MKDCNIKILPFELLNLIEYEGIKEENEHAFARFSGHIEENMEDTYVEMALNDLWVEVTAIDDTGETKTLLHGVLTDLKIEARNNVRLVSGTIKSGSFLMDTNPHIRSYQSPDLKYTNVLKSFTKQYDDSNYIMTKGIGASIPPLILQYQETDWNFAKRLASHFKTIIMPDCKTQGVKYFFGLPKFEDIAVIETKHYSMEKRVDEFIWKKKNGVDGIRESDAIYYTVKLRNIYELGSCIILNSRKLFVSKIVTRLEGAELYHTYYLKSENGFMTPRTHNAKAIGASLYANILAVEKDVVQITINKDENKSEAGVNWYPYSTVYSTPDGTGWYCMPEIGDAVRLYVPNHDEAKAYVISSTHLESSASDERVNPDYKSIMNKYHKEVLFKPDSLIFTNNTGMSIELLDDTGIRIISNKAIVIKSEEAINITSATSAMKVIAPQLISLKQGDTIMQLNDNIALKGAKVHLE